MWAVTNWAFTSASSPVCTSCASPPSCSCLTCSHCLTDCKDTAWFLNSTRRFPPPLSSDLNSAATCLSDSCQLFFFFFTSASLWRRNISRCGRRTNPSKICDSSTEERRGNQFSSPQLVLQFSMCAAVVRAVSCVQTPHCVWLWLPLRRWKAQLANWLFSRTCQLLIEALSHSWIAPAFTVVTIFCHLFHPSHPFFSEAFHVVQ